MKAKNGGSWIAPAIVACSLSGCTTASFSPPGVEVDRVIADQRPSACGTFAEASAKLIEKNVNGALELTNNFLRAYRCSAHEVANGRQIFQVPSFLATIAAVVGPTFGLNDDARIAAAASAAVLDRSNSYYAPKDKAQVLDSALDAVLCVKTESVEIEFFDTRADAPGAATNAAIQAIDQAAASAEAAAQSLGAQALDLERRGRDLAQQMEDPKLREASDGERRMQAFAGRIAALDAELNDVRGRKAELDRQAFALRRESGRLALLAAAEIQPNFRITKEVADGTIEVNVQRQYYEMVSASLFSIERVLAQRFSNIGSYDAAGIAAELKQLTGEQADADQDADSAGDAPVTAAPLAGQRAFASEEEKNEKMAELSLKQLQPRLQQCVVRAKI